VLGFRRIDFLGPTALDVREPAVGERDLLRVRLRGSRAFREESSACQGRYGGVVPFEKARRIAFSWAKNF